MEFIEEKMNKHENCLTKLLRKLLKQKDEKIKEINTENDHLKELVLKQQELLNKLNCENIQLSKHMNCQQNKNESKIDNKELRVINESLKEQLLISQNQNSNLLHNLQEAKSQIKQLKQQLSRYE